MLAFLHTKQNKLLSVLSVMMGRGEDEEQQQQEISVYRGQGKSSVDSNKSKKWWKKQARSSKAKDGRRSTIGAVLRPFKAAVASPKRRFLEDGFDLDLIYVTKRIIVHGVPDESSDSFYEDPRTEVRRLLDKYHHNRFKIYNFTSELVHMTPTDGELAAESRTERYPFADDTCPPLDSVVDFCENAKAWLDAHAENVVSLHCKAGKGRAGIMAACLMVRMGESARDAVANYDATQGLDIKSRSGENQSAWVFLYERLITKVWGLRDTIGTVSGQNPSLKAPPRVVSCLRGVSLQLQIPNGKKRWRPILYYPSCAVYQRKSHGKTLVHRCKMSPVYLRREDVSLSVFEASLPRTVIVEGTFQVVVSAATGVLGLAKNVLDVWCNTTFLGEEGGRETFKFTENDLPPGKLTERLLSANVSLVLIHTRPEKERPVPRQDAADSDGVYGSHDSGGRESLFASGNASSGTSGSALTMERPATTEATASADADEGPSARQGHEEAESERESTSATPVSVPSASEEDYGVRKFYLSSREGSVASSSSSPRGANEAKSLQLTLAVAEPERPPTDTDAESWNLGIESTSIVAAAMSYGLSTPSCSSGYITPARSGFATPARNGFMTPLSGRCRSPLRSCPRAAVSARKEKLNESDNRIDEPTTQLTAQVVPQCVDPQIMPSYPAASSAIHLSPGRATPCRERSPMLLAIETQPRVCGATLDDAERGSMSKPASRFKEKKIVCNDGSMRDASETNEFLPGVVSNVSNGQESVKKPSVLTLPSAASSSLGSVDEEAQIADHSFKLRELALLTKNKREPMTEGLPESDITVNDKSLRSTAEKNAAPQPTPSRGSKRTSPSFRVLLATAAKRSFEDPQSSRHTSVAGSETDQSEIMSRAGSFSDCDGESASLSAQVLAGWVGSGIRPRPLQQQRQQPREDMLVVSGLNEHRLVGLEINRETSTVASGVSASAKRLDSDDIRAIQPLKTRCWPPPPSRPLPRVVAGEVEIQEMLTWGMDEGTLVEAPSHGRPARKHGSTGTSCGEDAKLALARRRLQWEKSRGWATDDTSNSLRMHAAFVAKREAELLTIETDVKQAVRVLEERIARRQSAQAALKKWKQELPPKAYEDVMGCLKGNQTFGFHGSS